MDKENIFLSNDAFLRSFKQNLDGSFAFLIGAGASISSGVQSAEDCIWDWKRDIYISQNPTNKDFLDIRSEYSRDIIQKWLDNTHTYPPRGDESEYVFYAEKAYEIEEDRRKYFEHICKNKIPNVGYKLLCLLHKYGVLKSVWTTNFDGLVAKAATLMNMSPKEVTLSNSEESLRAESRDVLLCIALHGDYKYTRLKNTAQELDSQDDVFASRLQTYFVDRNLIVMGYSGRDKSLMEALKRAFSASGKGRLYWCGYGAEVPEPVCELIKAIRGTGREAFYISSNSFDDTLVSMLKSAYHDDKGKMMEIDSLLKGTEKEVVNTPFHLNTMCGGVINTNLYPVVLPKEIFQFDIKFPTNKKWDFLQERVADKDIIAVPYDKKVYAFGLSKIICQSFQDCLLQDPIRTPISTNEIRENGTFRRLFVLAISNGIAKHSNLQTSLSSGLIWNKDWRFEGQSSVFEAIRLSLVFKPQEKRYALLALTPTLYFADKVTFKKEDIAKTIREYVDGLRNKQYNDKLRAWEQLIFGGKNIKFDYPQDSGNGFIFTLGHTSGAIDVDYVEKGVMPERNIISKNNIFNGILLPEPELEYVNKTTLSPAYDENPMHGMVQNLPYDYHLSSIFKQDIHVGVICPLSSTREFASFLNSLNCPLHRESESDYIQSFPGFVQAYGCSLQIPNDNSDMWVSCKDKQDNPSLLAQKICEYAQIIASKKANTVVVIFIPRSWENHKTFNKDGESFDLHNYIKAFAAQNNFTSQIIEEKTIRDEKMRCEILWWLSLAIFVKSMRTPWALANLDENTAYAGIGYSLKKTPNGKSFVVLGCSHIYNAKGQGQKYKLSKIDNPILDKKNNPYLNHEEAYKLGLSIEELFAKSMSKFPKRVVIHKRTPFREEEIKGITDALKQIQITDVDLITITVEKAIRCVDLSKNRYGELYTCGFPVRRGICVLLSDNEFLLWTHGKTDSIINNRRSYYAGGKGIPSPLHVTKYYGRGDIKTIANEILGFTKMNWNSFNFYTKLPATIDTSNALAQVGNLLRNYNGVTYDYRYFI